MKRNDDLDPAAVRMSPMRRLIAALALAIGVVASLATPALAASTHPFKESWTLGPSCKATSIDTDAQGNVYVFCSAKGTNGLIGSIRKYSATGAPVPFEYFGDHISGNEINSNPFNPAEWVSHQPDWGENVHIAVAKSGPRAGYIFAAGNNLASQDVYIFAPSGKYVTSLKGGYGKGEAANVGFDDDGYIYVDFEGVWCTGCSHISKFDPANFHEVERMVPSPVTSSGFDALYYAPCCGDIAADSNGAIWVGWGFSWFTANGIGKIEADQWTTNLRGGAKDSNTVLAHTSPYLLEAFSEQDCPEASTRPHPCALPGSYVAVDLSKNDAYVDDGAKITPYSEGKEGDPVHQNGPSFGSGVFTGGGDLTIAPDDSVYVATADTIYRFSRGFTLPTVTTRDAAVGDIGHTSAVVRGDIDPDGGGEITGCRVAYGETKAYGGGSSPVPCDQAMPLPEGTTTEVSATLPNLTVGHTYHFRFEAANEHGWNIGGDRTLEARAVLGVKTEAATEVHRHDVTMQGELDADGMETEYWYEYGLTKAYNQDTLDDEGKGVAISGSPGQIEQTPLLVGHLLEGRIYHYRLVAKNALGVTYGKDQIVRTASPPGITGVGSSEVTENAADLHAVIDPNGNETTYRFEYGTSVAYGRSLPLPDGQVSGSAPPQTVIVHLEGLPTATTVHYRVVATNKWGTTATDDTTFNFRPPACPNSHVRQVTGSSYLPDCRAYELVSPGYAGAVSLMPGSGLIPVSQMVGPNGASQAPQNRGYATSPSRMMYLGSLGAVDGVDAQNTIFDLYLSTRTNTGWVTTYPGLHGSEEKVSGGRICSDGMDECIDHPGPNYGAGVFHPSNSPYLYRADGTRVGRLPTNIYTVKGGTEYLGDEEMSGDFSHYFFSTQTRFAPGGVESAPGSVYDNDIAAQTVTVVSKTADGQDIAAEPAVAGDPQRITGIVGSSTDGSRVLMAATTRPHCSVFESFLCPSMLDWPVRLYLREADALTYDVSAGAEVTFAGMTRDASQVFFTTTTPLLPQDQDTSADLYRWSAQGDQLTLISQQGALGNDDDCSASWTEKCGVEGLKPLRWDSSQTFDRRTFVPGVDDLIANESGDVYFYSPEDLVEGEVGGDGQRNLYLYRNGQLRLVAPLEANAPIERDTISQDGSHAAFLTKSSLTSYDAKGTRQVYTYDAAKGTLRCASCNPDGAAPIPGDHNVAASETGPFMANDGRTFFTTKEALVPQDTDGIMDVYEYVEGRPQLITSGSGYRDNTGGLETFSLLFGPMDLGLEAVSRNGTDVYFTSYETLVPQDQNGEFVKVYDARSGGGFDASVELGQCAAADECHDAPSQPSAPAIIGSAGSQADGGNLSPHAHRRKHHKKHKKHRHKKHANAHRSHRHG